MVGYKIPPWAVDFFFFFGMVERRKGFLLDMVKRFLLSVGMSGLLKRFLPAVGLVLIEACEHQE